MTKESSHLRRMRRPLVAAALSCSAAASAQEAGLFAEDLVEGTRVTVSMETGASYTDNFFYTETDRREDGSGLLVRPGVALSRILPRFKFLADAGAEFGWFDLPGSVDDYGDYRFSLGSEWQSAARHRFSFVSRLREGHDPFGTERTEGTALENRDIDEWRDVRTDVTYRYGLPTDIYNIELRVIGQNKEYQNNRDVTQFLDHEKMTGELLAYYNLSGKTALFLDIIGTRSYYETVASGAIDRGAEEWRYLLGTRWLATGKTSGTLGVGYIDRSPRDQSRDNLHAIDWRVSVTWSPQIVRSFTLQSGRNSQESYLNTVEYIDNRYVALDWTEHWTARLRTKATARYVASDFVGDPREDRSWGYGLETEYLLTPSLTLLGQASNGHRESDVFFAEYDRTYVYLGGRYVY